MSHTEVMEFVTTFDKFTKLIRDYREGDLLPVRLATRERPRKRGGLFPRYLRRHRRFEGIHDRLNNHKP